MKKKILALACCHNRHVETVNSLHNLNNQVGLDDFDVQYVLVNDGSTDNTSKIVSSKFPYVDILEGSGDLYWAGAMRLGYEFAINKYTFDYLFVYNDDSILFSDSLAKLLAVSQENSGSSLPCIITGTFIDPDTNTPTYGGVLSGKYCPLKFSFVGRVSEITLVDTLNMNGALIPYTTLKEVGFFADYFIHGGADYEYGLRVSKKNKGKIYLIPGVIGYCSRNEPYKYDYNNGVINHIKTLLSTKRLPFYPRYKFYSQYSKYCFIPYLLYPYVKQTLMFAFKKIYYRFTLR